MNSLALSDNNCMVSIICSAYNHAKYIRDALNGFIMQKTTFNFEVLIHDDASTDGTAEIIKEYEKKYPEIIKPIYQIENQYSKHLGLVTRILKSRTSSKYVAMCEGDDYWTDPFKLQKQFDFMENNPDYMLCGCSTSWLNMLNGKVMNKSKTKSDRDVTLEELVFSTNGRVFPFVSFFLRTEIWKNMPNWGFPIGDIPLTYYAALNGKVRMLADCMCVYRWYADGSWTMRKGNNDKRAKVCEQMIIGLDNVNAFTAGQYFDVFERGKLHYKYALALMNRDFNALRSTELNEIYKKRDLVHKMSDYIRCKFPKLYLKLQIIFGRNL